MSPNTNQVIQNQIHELSTKVELVSKDVINNQKIMNQQLVDAKIYSDKLSELNVTNSDKLGELNTTIKLFLQDFKNVFEGILQKAQTSEKALVKVEERVDVLEKVQAEATTTIKNVKVLIGFFGVTTLVGIYEFVDKFLKK